MNKAKELGLDWWAGNPAFASQAPPQDLAASLARMDERLGHLESALAMSGAG